MRKARCSFLHGLALLCAGCLAGSEPAARSAPGTYRPLPPARRRKALSVEGGLGTASGGVVLHAEGVFIVAWIVALTGYAEHIGQAGMVLDYDLVLLSPGVELCFARGSGVTGPFLRFGPVWAGISLNDSDLELLSDDTAFWFEVRGGYRFCFGNLVLCPQLRYAAGESFVVAKYGGPEWEERSGDIAVMATLGLAF